MAIRTRYTHHVLTAHLRGFQALTLRQYVALAAAIRFGG